MAIIGATLLGAAAFAGPAQAGIGVPHAAVAFGDPVDPFGHFPAWYQDDEGQQIGLCLDPAAAECALVLPDDTLPIAFSAVDPAANNFPDESFYQRAIAIVGAKIQLTYAQEATYGGTDGTQSVFGRVRIRDLAGELTDGEWYRFTQPGGQVDLQAPVNFSSDVGCIETCIDDAAFNTPLASDLAPTFLQRDSRTGVAPAGLMAAAGAAQAMVGSKFIPPGETQPANFFRVEHITGDGGTVTSLVGQTDQFEMLIPGTIVAGAPVGSLVNSSGQLGGQRVGTPGARNVTLTNAGSGNVVLTSLAPGGPDAGQFAVNGAACVQTLTPGDSCTATVTFTPNGVGPRTAQISATETTPSGPKIRPVKLLGTGIQPTLALPAGSIAFGSQLVGSVVGPRSVAVRNTGTDTLHVNSATLGGATDYSLGLNTCDNQNVAPNAQCTVEVFFTPQAAGARDAALNVSTDAGAGSVPISGTGVTTAAAVTPGAAAGTAAGTPAGTAPLTTAPNTGQSTATKLKLKSLGGPRKIKRSKATKTGIRLSIGLNSGTKVVRIRIFRKTRSGALKLVSTSFRHPASTTARYRVTQRQSAVRKAFKVLGSYRAEVTPGASNTDLGKASRLSFKIVR